MAPKRACHIDQGLTVPKGPESDVNNIGGSCVPDWRLPDWRFSISNYPLTREAAQATGLAANVADLLGKTQRPKVLWAQRVG